MGCHEEQAIAITFVCERMWKKTVSVDKVCTFQLPRVPYTKSIDVWMSVCLIFVFAAYMQYGFVTVFSRRHRKCQGSFVSHDSSVANRRASSIETIVSCLYGSAHSKELVSLVNQSAAGSHLM